jgi:hypothetical protein
MLLAGRDPSRSLVVRANRTCNSILRKMLRVGFSKIRIAIIRGKLLVTDSQPSLFYNLAASIDNDPSDLPNPNIETIPRVT